MLGYDMVAVSNTPTAEQIHAIVDRYRTAALPFSGSSVLSDYYSQVPALSIAWGIGRIRCPSGRRRSAASWRDASARRGHSVYRVGALLGSCGCGWRRSRPARLTPRRRRTPLQSMLGPALRSHDVRSGNNPQSKEYRALINSATVTQHDSRTVLTATVPLDLVKQFASGTQ